MSQTYLTYGDPTWIYHTSCLRVQGFTFGGLDVHLTYGDSTQHAPKTEEREKGR